MSSRDELIQTADQRANTIEAYIDSNPLSSTGIILNAFADDKIEALKVYKLPRHMLLLNPNNGRFKAELDIIHKDRANDGKPIELNPTDSDDNKTIQDMIRGEYPHSSERKSAFKALKENIFEISQKTDNNGQEVAGLITYDGILINGNRRWVVMEDLAGVSKRKKGEPLKYDFLLVARLSKGVSPYDLWKNEAKEQISQESREEYDYVNSALEIKRGFDMLTERGMTEKKAKAEITKTLFGRSEKDVTGYLDFLEMADLFLEEIGKKDEYTYIQESEGKKGIVTILHEVSQERKKYIKNNLPLEELGSWTKAMCAFCRFSKEKPEVHLSDGTKRKLTFEHREYRTFQKKVIEQPEMRKKFLTNPIIDEIDIKTLDEEDVSKFYRVIRDAQEEYDIKLDINTPVSLLKKAQIVLSKVSQDLTGSRKSDMVEQIRKEGGLQYIKDIKNLLRDIGKKINE